MKASMIGLMVATTAFGGTSLYLWQQLEDARTRAALAEDAMHQLSQRVGQMQSARAPHMQRDVGIDRGFASAGIPAPHMPSTSTTTAEKEEQPAVGNPWTVGQRHEVP